MTEPIETAEAADEQVVETPPPDEGVDTTDDQQSDDNREAAKYRHRAKAAEAERDQLAERLQVLQRAEVQRRAAEHLADGADIWRDGATLEDLLTDSGDIDPDKVSALAKGLVDAHRHWRKTAPAAPPASAVTSNGKIGGRADPEVTWEDVIKKSRREVLEQRQRQL
jgi:hypothetical protein